MQPLAPSALQAQPLDLSTLKLADFGFATAAPRDGRPRAPDRGLQGTVEYAAPEILAAYRGRGRPTPPGEEADAAVRSLLTWHAEQLYRR